MADRAAELHGGWLWTRGGGASPRGETWRRRWFTLVKDQRRAVLEFRAAQTSPRPLARLALTPSSECIRLVGADARRAANGRNCPAGVVLRFSVGGVTRLARASSESAAEAGSRPYHRRRPRSWRLHQLGGRRTSTGSWRGSRRGGGRWSASTRRCGPSRTAWIGACGRCATWCRQLRRRARRRCPSRPATSSARRPRRRRRVTRPGPAIAVLRVNHRPCVKRRRREQLAAFVDVRVRRSPPLRRAEVGPRAVGAIRI